MKKFNIKDLALKFEKAKTVTKRHSSLQITDNLEIIADGCLKIINCDENIIVILLFKNRLTVSGTDLKMRNWGTDGVMINGFINSVEFEETKPGIV